MKTQVQEAVPTALLYTLESEIQLAPSCRRDPLRSTELLDDDGRLLIEHDGKLYELRSLPGGRLILTGWGGSRRHIAHRSLTR